MNRVLSFLAIAGFTCLLASPAALAAEPTAEDYIAYHKPLVGTWELKVEEGDKVVSGTWTFRLTPNKKCYLSHLELEGEPAAEALEGYDPSSKKWTIVSFDAGGTYQVATLDVADMKPGKVIGVGLVGTWKETRFGADGTVITATETLTCKKLDDKEMVFVWSDRQEDGKVLPDWNLTAKRKATKASKQP
jgi:hypothetical protein